METKEKPKGNKSKATGKAKDNPMKNHRKT